MPYRSDYLVHWTGKDISTDISNLNTVQRQAYINRLEGTLKTGLWMNDTTEKVGTKENLEVKTPVTCFTEVRITQSREHTSNYGLLGLGFDRKFLLDRDGAPVIYLRNSDTDVYMPILYNIWKALQSNGQLLSQFKVLAGLLKAMSSPNMDDFTYLHEAEWRLVQNNSLTEKNLLSPPTGNPKPRFYVPFGQNDLKLIILPDEECRQLFYGSSIIEKWMTKHLDRPIVLTYEKLFEY